MEFARNYLVHYYEADSSQHLTLPSLVQYFEDIAILHSASYGFDLDYFNANHCGWMLLKWDIDVHRLPRFNETVRVSTHVHAMKTFSADREFTLSAADGTVLANARSNWLRVDTVRRRPARIPPEEAEKFGVSKENESSFISIDDVPSVDGLTSAEAAGSLAGADGSVYRTAIRTVTSDIDTNAHVNNVSYIHWAFDSLPPDFAGNRVPSGLKVQYRKELGIACEAEVVSRVSPASDLTRHTVRSPEEEYCSLEIRWKEKN